MGHDLLVGMLAGVATTALLLWLFQGQSARRTLQINSEQEWVEEWEDARF